LAETLVSRFRQRPGHLVHALRGGGAMVWCGWAPAVSTLLGPEGTTVGCLFGFEIARHGLVPHTAERGFGFGVGLVGCGLVVC
jgi:hypothetical protein